MPDLITKAEFARRVGVGRSCVSAWVGTGKLDGALVQVGRSVKVDEEAARRVLGDRLDVDQRITNGRARLGGESFSERGAVDQVTAEIKAERLRQLRHLNTKLEAEAAVTAGRFVEADAVKIELGRTAARLIVMFEGALPELAEAVAVRGGGVDPVFERDALHALRGAWRAIRGRLAGAESAAAIALPELVEADP